MRLYAQLGQPIKIRQLYASLKETLLKEINAFPTKATRLKMEELLKVAAQQISVPLTSSIQEVQRGEQIDALEREALQYHATMPPAQAKRPVWAVALAGALLLLIVAKLAYRPAKPTSSAKPVAVPLQYNQEKWKFVYSLQEGEKGDAEPTACTVNNYMGDFFVTGLVQTEKEDVDILTLHLSKEGKLLHRSRFSSPTHDCDRAFSITQEIRNGDTKAVYVAGETYIPASQGVQEGFRLTLIKYDANLTPQWVRYSPITSENRAHKIRVETSTNGSIVLGGTALEKGVHKILLLKYTPAGDLAWQREYNPQAKDTTFSDMGVSAKGEIFLCGTTLKEVSQSGSHTEWVTLCYSPEGNLQWSQFNAGKGQGADTATHIILASYPDSIYVSGVFYNGDPATGGTGTNLALAQYGIDGTPHWTRTAPDSGPEVLSSSFAKSSRPDIITIGGTKATPERNSVIYLCQYDSMGNFRWKHHFLAPNGFQSTHDPLFVQWESDEIAFSGSLSPLPAVWQHTNDQFLFARYTLEGNPKSQYAFKMAGDMHRPRFTIYSSKDNTVLVGGQAQQADKRMAWVVFKYEIKK